MAETHKEMIQDILNIEIPLELKLSPDCKSVIYMTRPKWYHKTGDRRSSPLWIADTGRLDSAHHLTDGVFADRFPQWSPCGQTIGFLSDRANTSGKSVALYLLDLEADVDADADKPRAITPTENERAIPEFSFSPSGKSIAYITTAEESVEAKTRNEVTGGASVWGEDWDYAQLKLVHIETGHIKTISDKEAHVTDFAWSDDSTKIAVVTHQTPILKVTMYTARQFSSSISQRARRPLLLACLGVSRI